MAESLVIPLSAAFRFIHEPLGATVTGDWKRFVARANELEGLVARILLSEGGAFLITGYRGVGKTTFVNRVVDDLGRQLPKVVAMLGPTEVVDIYLNLARPVSEVELMYYLLRSLYGRLLQKGYLKRIDPRLRQDLELAYMRTSVTMNYKTSSQSEKSFGLGDATVPVPFLGLAPKLSMGVKHSNDLTREFAYLAYDDRAAEHDLIQIVRALANKPVPRSRGLRGAIQRFGRRAPQAIRLKIVFIFDELDKLDEDRKEEGSALDRILSNLKNLFTTSGATFLFVAGKDLHDHWLEDLGKGNSIYESVFTYAKYLPALWTQVDALCDPWLDSPGAQSNSENLTRNAYADFKKFLAFKGRGIPRRILRGFNEHVHWKGNKPYLKFSREDVRRFHFYASLYDALQLEEDELLGKLHDEDAAEKLDQQRLSLYYLTDWILQRGLADFTVEEAIAASRRLSRQIAPAEDVAPDIVSALVQRLKTHDYVEYVPQRNNQVQIGGQVPASGKQYRLVRRRLVEMGNLSGLFEQEAQSLFAQEPVNVAADRYQILSLIGEGGMSRTHKAIDNRTGRIVAIKELPPRMLSIPDFRTRLEREAEILARLQHPNIVRLYDVEITSVRFYIVMEFIDGVSLAEVIRQKRLNDENSILRLGRELLHAVEYIHQHGVLWRDPKPSNIMITTEGRLVILDFGIARDASLPTITSTGMAMGTPAYMSPEQWQGAIVDQRSDIYGIGVVLYEMVTGRPPYEADTPMGLMNKVLSDPVTLPSHYAQVGPALESVILKCLEKDPANRYESASAALAALPEAVGSGDYSAAVRTALEASLQVVAREQVHTATQISLAPVPLTMAEPISQILVAMGAPRVVERPRLLLTSDTNRQVYTLDKPRVSLGRSDNNDIVLDEPDASRYHAMLTERETQYCVEDLNSANGTFVNDESIHEPQDLKNGDTIRIGKSVLVYVAA